MRIAELAEPPESESFERLRSRLQALTAATPPHINPRALAVRALLVTDHLGRADVRRRVEALARAGACDPRSVDDLRMAARSVMYALSRRGDASETGDSPQATALRAEAVVLRRAAIENLESLDGDEARLWLDAFRLPTNDVELVYDLRSIALLYEEHGPLLGEGFDPSGSALAARRSADALERGLMGAAAQGEWSQWLARAFSLTLSLYTEVCRIAQSLGGTDGFALACPSAAGIARSVRRNRDTTSSSFNVRRASPNAPASGAAPAHSPAPPPAPAPVRAAAPPPAPAAAPVRAAAPAPPPAPVHAAAPAPPPELDLIPEPESRPASEPATDSARARRRSERLSAELEVGLLSDSNFYVGFTENVSEGGLFVATYLTRPLGSTVEICARIPGRAEPLIVRGTVRWLREYSPTSDGYPGMGIQFDSISERDQSDIAAFLVTRDPLFFVD